MENEPINNLTTRQGHPVTDNQNMRTVGDRGPAVMENYQFMKKSRTLTESVCRNELYMPEVYV